MVFVRYLRYFVVYVVFFCGTTSWLLLLLLWSYRQKRAKRAWRLANGKSYRRPDVAQLKKDKKGLKRIKKRGRRSLDFCRTSRSDGAATSSLRCSLGGGLLVASFLQWGRSPPKK